MDGDLCVCITHGRRTVKQESVARAKQARLVGSSKQSVQPAGHSDPRHSCDNVSSLKGQHTEKVNRGRDSGQNIPQTMQMQHGIAWLDPNQLPQRGQLNTLRVCQVLRAAPPTHKRPEMPGGGVPDRLVGGGETS